MAEEKKVAGRFSPAELLPQTGNPRPLPYATEAERQAARAWDAVLRSIYVQNPNHKAVFTALDNVLTLGVKGEYQTGVRNSAPSYAGKSASADAFARIVAARGTYPAGTMPIVRVELEQACTSKRFWTAILSKYGDGFASSKDEDAEKLLASNDQLSTRLEDPCDIQPLALADTAAKKICEKFVRNYDAQLVSKKVFTVSSNLTDERVVACLMAVSRGYLGRVVKLLQVAARHAHRRSAERIEPFDLSQATIRWAVQQNLIGYDPFTFGMVKHGG